MLINIRRGVFETNSSSTHSVAIVRSNDWVDLKQLVNDNNCYRAIPGSFSTEDLPLFSMEEKLAYIITAIYYYEEHEKPENSEYFRWLAEMFFDHTGFKLIYQLAPLPHPRGCIEDASMSVLEGYWEYEENKFKHNMKELIFNQRYCICMIESYY